MLSGKEILDLIHRVMIISLHNVLVAKRPPGFNVGQFRIKNQSLIEQGFILLEEPDLLRTVIELIS